MPPQVEAALRDLTKAQGIEVAVLAARLLSAALSAPNVDELLAPLRRQVEASGASDKELDALCEQLREEVWREQQAGASIAN